MPERAISLAAGGDDPRWPLTGLDYKDPSGGHRKICHLAGVTGPGGLVRVQETLGILSTLSGLASIAGSL